MYGYVNAGNETTVTKDGIYYCIGSARQGIMSDDGILIVSTVFENGILNKQWLKISSSGFGIAIKRNSNDWQINAWK